MSSIQEQYKELYENFESVVDHLRTVYEGDDPDNYLDQLQCQLDKARPVSDESDTTKTNPTSEELIWASGHFLTIPFPLNFRDFSDARVYSSSSFDTILGASDTSPKIPPAAMRLLLRCWLRSCSAWPSTE